MVQCKCKTDDGSICKHPANPKSSHGYCTQHNKPKHAKMRCVSLARPTIGYKSPAKRPSSPRPSSVKKSAKKSKSRSKKSAKKSKSRSKKSAKKSKSRSKKSAKKSKSRSKKSAKKSKSRSKKSAKKSAKKSKSRSKKSKSLSKKSAKKSIKKSAKKSRSKKSGKKTTKMRRYRMDGGASAPAAAGPRIRVGVRNMAGSEDDYDFPAGATVKDLMHRATDEKFLGDTTCFQKLRVTDMKNMEAGALPCNTPLVDSGEYNILQLSFEPGNLLRTYGPEQNKVRYFSPPDANGEPIPFDC